MASGRALCSSDNEKSEGRKEGRKEGREGGGSLGKTTKGRNPVATCEEGKEVHPSGLRPSVRFFEAGPSLNEVEDDPG